ncbi:hypothetical protein NBT05_10050 [Aquimarina sp. ERC-38]|uniref:hypothetical protein n=1 Tax=Aquimarina sp. ERC-38 TaxID=2949996 RepID=UPI002246E3BC|nr:hypothetical protein [Aquimarina sp. ERC-38]UZO79312.1 hypothetical protein NBT05_10050 [Aquimarina sp. ERC-38]
MKNIHIFIFTSVFILTIMTSLTSISNSELNDTTLNTTTMQFDGYEGNTYFFTTDDQTAFVIKGDGHHKLWEETNPNKRMIGQKFVVRYTANNSYKKSIIDIKDVIASWKAVDDNMMRKRL